MLARPRAFEVALNQDAILDRDFGVVRNCVDDVGLSIGGCLELGKL
jgi:hypothetical protein